MSYLLFWKRLEIETAAKYAFSYYIGLPKEQRMDILNRLLQNVAKLLIIFAPRMLR